MILNWKQASRDLAFSFTVTTCSAKKKFLRNRWNRIGLKSFHNLNTSINLSKHERQPVLMQID